MKSKCCGAEEVIDKIYNILHEIGTKERGYDQIQAIIKEHERWRPTGLGTPNDFTNYRLKMNGRLGR